jgi:hypothetical protein
VTSADFQASDCSAYNVCTTTACGTGGDNRTTKWSDQAIRKYAGLSRGRTDKAMAELKASGLVREDQGGARPRYYLMPAHEVPGCEGHGLSKLFLTIAAAFAEAERDRIRERIGQVKADQKARRVVSRRENPLWISARRRRRAGRGPCRARGYPGNGRAAGAGKGAEGHR